MMQLKSDVVILLRDFLAMLINQFGKKVKSFRSKNSIVFFNSKCSELFK